MLLTGPTIGLEQGALRNNFFERFQVMMKGMWSVPLNFPFTCYNRSLKASMRVKNMLKELKHEKRKELEQECGIAVSKAKSSISQHLSCYRIDSERCHDTVSGEV